MMKIKVHIFISLILFFVVSNLHAENHEDKIENKVHHPIWPVFLGAGLISWGVYELGEDTEEGQRNVKILWGSAAIASVGIVLYQWQQDKGKEKQLSIKTISNTPVLEFSYIY